VGIPTMAKWVAQLKQERPGKLIKICFGVIKNQIRYQPQIALIRYRM
jgi:hypothetical protein